MKVLLAHAPRLLVTELAARRYRLCVAHFPGEWPPGHSVADTCHFQGFRYRQKADPRSIYAMRRLVVDHRPDIIHAFSPRSLAAAALGTVGLRSPPHIVSFRGISTPPSRTSPSDLITFLWPRVTAHTCESHAVAEAMVRAGIDRRSCHVIYNCVDPRTTARWHRDEVRARLGIPPTAFVIGSIANVRPVKGIDLLLRAALECLDLEDLQVLVVGSIRDRAVEKLATDARWRGRLHLSGFVPDGGGMATGLDLFVMPSRQEALCRALLEAMNFGVCPIVSDAGGMKEVVRHDKEGLVFPRENVESLVTAIRRLHQSRDLVTAFGDAARERVRSLCTPAAMADRVERVYDSIMPMDRQLSSAWRQVPGHRNT